MLSGKGWPTAVAQVDFTYVNYQHGAPKGSLGDVGDMLSHYEYTRLVRVMGGYGVPLRPGS